MHESGKQIVMDCNCGKSKRMLRYIYEDYQVEAECLSCGKVHIIGSIEKEHKIEQEKKDGRLKAEENRDRYTGERDEEFKREFHRSLNHLTAIPDPIANFYQSQSPNFKEMEWLKERKRRNRLQVSQP